MQRPPYPPSIPRQRSDSSQWALIGLIVLLACALVGVGSYAVGVRQGSKTRDEHRVEFDFGFKKRPMFRPDVAVTLNQWHAVQLPAEDPEASTMQALVCNITLRFTGEGQYSHYPAGVKMVCDDHRIYMSTGSLRSLGYDVFADNEAQTAQETAVFGRHLARPHWSLAQGGVTTSDVVFKVPKGLKPLQIGIDP